MRLALDGDQIAYRSLLAAIAPHVRNQARRALGRAGRGHAEVDDVVQETLLAGRSAADVGGALGMSEGAVRVALHRAPKRLAQTFKGGRDAH